MATCVSDIAAEIIEERFGLTDEDKQSEIGLRIYNVAYLMEHGGLYQDPVHGHLQMAVEALQRLQAETSSSGLPENYQRIVAAAVKYGADVPKEFLDLVDL